MKKKLCTILALTLVMASVFALSASAASHYTGNRYATYGAGRVGVEAYIYYSTNTASAINITSSVIFVRNEVSHTLGPVYFTAIEQPAYRPQEYRSNVSIKPGALQRVEAPVNRSFSKTTGTNGYVFCQSSVAANDVLIGWDTFCYASSFSSSFHS